MEKVIGKIDQDKEKTKAALQRQIEMAKSIPIGNVGVFISKF
jgi:hypothetical protein